MNSRLRKEFRPLMLPWVVAVGCVAVACVLSQIGNAGEFESFLITLAKLTFPGGLLLLASSSFGIELQQHTLALLLSQPVDRTRVWGEKMFVLVVSIGTAVLAAALLLMLVSLGYSSPVLGLKGDELYPSLFEKREVVLFGVFLVATVCSCGFWTLVAGSTIGGFVFTIAGQFVAGAVVAGAIAWIHGQDQAFEDSQTLPALAITGVVYSAVFLWLGWRKFVRLEVRPARLGQTMAQSGITNWNVPWAGMLVSRPGQRVQNLIRKELRLERPVFLLAAVFVVCWLATGLLQWLRPHHNITYVFDVLTCLYGPLVALLAGCVPLGEEKALGLTASQLTLPFSQRLQWLIKLGAGVGTAAVLCLALPSALFWVTGRVFDVSTSGVMNPNDNGILALASICGFAFLSGYWAIAMTANTVRAALVAVCGLVTLGACATLGAWLGQQSNGWQTAPLAMIMCHFQLAPDVLQEQARRVAWIIFYGLTIGIILLCLVQSLIQFRKTEQIRHKLFSYSLALSMLVVGLVFWSIDFGSSTNRLPDSGPMQELRGELNFFASKDTQTDIDGEHVIPAQELEGSLRMTESTRIWLRKATITYHFLPARTFKNGDTSYPYQALIAFPNGERFSFSGGYVRGPQGVKGHI
jgi:hypothetical protein